MVMRGEDRKKTRENTDHEGLKIWSPPLCKAVTYFPFVVYAMCDTELLRVPRRGEAFVEAAFKTVDLIFARFKVITGTNGRVRISSEMGMKKERKEMKDKTTKWRMEL